MTLKFPMLIDMSKVKTKGPDVYIFRSLKKIEAGLSVLPVHPDRSCMYDGNIDILVLYMGLFLGDFQKHNHKQGHRETSRTRWLN